jgi:calcium-translocating P-type ATPase
MGLVTPKARVVREGHEWEIDSVDLVPGDVVLLESGMRVAADLRLSSTTSLRVDESLLTGESAPVSKNTRPVGKGHTVAERSDMAHTGSVVTRGRGRGYVVAIGNETELGAIAEEIRGAEVQPTPLQERMRRFAHLIGAVVAASAVLAFVIGVLLDETPTEMFMVAVALAVAAVPEGLPIVFTIALALGVRRMAQRNAIIRKLPAVETLGSTTVIGSDKTGTLTQNQMMVQSIWTPTGTVELDSSSAEPITAEMTIPSPDAEPLELTALAGVVANEAELFFVDDEMHTSGDPTEVALLVSALRVGIDVEAVDDAYRPVAEIPFEPERRFAASVRDVDGRRYVFVKGAPERVLEMCDRLPGGEPVDRGRVQEAARAMARRGLRVLGMAVQRVEDVESLIEHAEPSGLTFLGLQGMLDPPRPGVAESIAACRQAGMRVVMITGDHVLTATAIGKQLGIATDDSEALTGEELERMSDDDLEAVVADVAVYARVSPVHKLRVVRALQHQGEIVAVTGDGVNDAPALRRADIGVAMGKGGTDVAREAADMVLADDNFTSISAAVEEGRVTFDNVRKVSFFLVSTGAAAIFTIFAALALGWPIPFVPAQLLWMNLVTKGLQDVALAFEPGEEGVLDRPPRRKAEGIISPLLWERTVITGVVMAAGTLVLFRWALDDTASLELAQTVALTTMVVYQALHVGNSRSEYRSVFKINLFSNRFLVAAQLAALTVHVAALYLPPTQFVLRVEPIPLDAWPRILAMSITIVAAIELHKLLRRPGRQAPTSAVLEPG